MLSAVTPRDAPLYNHFASESKAAILVWKLSDETAASALGWREDCVPLRFERVLP